MANENELDEIDQYLVTKISLAIKDSGEPKYLVAKSFPYKAEFESLLTDLSRKTNPKAADWDSVRRGNLYSLNNLVTEWLQLTKKDTSLSTKEVLDVCDNIKKGLRKMKKDVNGDQDDPEGSTRRSVHDQEPKHQIFERHTKEVYRWSSRHPPRRVHGFDHKVLLMERELVMRNTSAPFKVYGIVGAPGIGKTTLCQTIFGQNSVKQHFSPRIWVCLSPQRYDRTDYRVEIVVRMLNCLGMDDEVIDNAEKGGLKKLILLLRLQLIGKNYLIILDDAWKPDKFFYNLNKKDRLDENWCEKLAYALPKGDGGTVIASSRSKGLLKDILGEDVSLQYMEPLSREIMYKIFKDAVIGYDDDEREYHKDLDLIKEELLDKCDGVPFAAKLLAKIAWKNLEIMPKSQQTTTSGGAHVPEIGHDHTA